MVEKTASHLVDPATLKGFQDLLPEDMILRNRVVDKVRTVYERFGFVPIDTPILEHLATLVGTGGEDINKELFRLESPEGDAIAMRFDLTVPFARIVAQYADKIELPFRRYHIGPVFRADKPGPGRYRQFTQFDIDAAGSDSVAVDAEIVAAMCEVMQSLGLQRSLDPGVQEYQVRVNNRKLLDAFLGGCGVDDDQVRKHILRVIDKLQKAGIENVRKELGEGRVDESGDSIIGVGLTTEPITRILRLVEIESSSRGRVVDEIEKLLPDSQIAQLAIAEMRLLDEALTSLGVWESEARFDVSLTRGLDYYTGPVFEAFLPMAVDFGSVMGGGRYDQLVARFLDKKIPATGASIGLERLLAGLKSIGKVETHLTTTKVLVVSLAGVPVAALLSVAKELRDKGLPVEVYFGSEGVSMREQLAYANAKDIPVAVIIGTDELASGKVSVKNLIEGRAKRSNIEDHAQYRQAGRVGQSTVSRAEMVPTVLSMLE